LQLYSDSEGRVLPYDATKLHRWSREIAQPMEGTVHVPGKNTGTSLGRSQSGSGYFGEEKNF
jgi:hypothetical protein